MIESMPLDEETYFAKPMAAVAGRADVVELAWRCITVLQENPANRMGSEKSCP